MTKPRNSNETRITKPESAHSSFGLIIHSDFWFRHSGFTTESEAQVSTTTVPLILTPRVVPTRISVGARLLALLITVACLCVFLFAAYLTPNPDGTATHTALGFNNCQFLAASNVPCPTCGMTT